MDKSSKPISTRAQFGRNLRLLSSGYPSISEVCRQLDINRAQFNRYLNGESYPRPDLLARICEFFETDPRILTDPLENIAKTQPDLMTHPEIRAFTATQNTKVSEEALPSGIYRFSRRSFMFPESFVIGLMYIYRRDGWTFIKGAETRKSVREQGLSDDPSVRQYRGYVQKLEGGFGAMVSRRNAMTSSFSFVTPVASFDRNFWHGYTARTISESISTTRVTRLVYEYVGQSTNEILSTARNAGLCQRDDLPPYHQRLLRLGEPFS